MKVSLNKFNLSIFGKYNVTIVYIKNTIKI